MTWRPKPFKAAVPPELLISYTERVSGRRALWHVYYFCNGYLIYDPSWRPNQTQAVADVLRAAKDIRGAATVVKLSHVIACKAVPDAFTDIAIDGIGKREE